MPWRVELGSDAERALHRLRGDEVQRMKRAIDALEADPRRAGKAVKAIQGKRDRFLRFRVGDRRILYEIDDDRKVVIVEAIVHRKDLDWWLSSRR